MFGNMKATRNWRVIYPTSHLSDPSPPWVVMLVSSSTNTNQWSQIQIPNTRDLINEILEDVIHHRLEGSWAVGEAKEHNQGFEEASIDRKAHV